VRESADRAIGAVHLLQRRHPGHNEAWNFTDINYMASAGVSVNGEAGQRSGDTFGLAGVMSGISHQNQEFLEARGSGILDDDGPLSYGWEKVLETYYDFRIWEAVHATLDTSSSATRHCRTGDERVFRYSFGYC